MGKDDKKEDDGMTDGIPTEVSKAMDAAFAKAEEENTDDEPVNDEPVDDEPVNIDDKPVDDEPVDDEPVDDPPVEGIDVLNWDADTVQKLNEINPDLVEDVKALLEQTAVKKVSEDTTKTVPKATEGVKVEGAITEEQLAELEKENPAMAAIVKNLNTKVGQLTTALTSVTEDETQRTEEAKQKEEYRNFRSTNTRLDKLSEDFPVLGTFDKLPADEDGVLDARNRAVRIRSKIWGKANALFGTGIFGSFEESLESAVTLYQGENAENSALRKVSKELKGRAKTMTNRPSKMKTKVKQPKPGSDEAKEKVVTDALVLSEEGAK